MGALNESEQPSPWKRRLRFDSTSVGCSPDRESTIRPSASFELSIKSLSRNYLSRSPLSPDRLDNLPLIHWVLTGQRSRQAIDVVGLVHPRKSLRQKRSFRNDTIRSRLNLTWMTRRIKSAWGRGSPEATRRVGRYPPA
jgi:hypothetical protein